jgi:hypothetical protein
MRIIFSIVSILILVLICLLWINAEFWVKYVFGGFVESKSFGDIFNSLGALFTALAFAGLLITIIYQRLDFNQQNRINNIQTFENNFFRLLEQHHRVIDSFVIKVKPNDANDPILPYPEERSTITQLEAFDFLAKDFKHRWNAVKEIRRRDPNVYQNTFIYAFLHHTYGKYGYMLGHYYRNLYHIVKFINDNKSLKNYESKYKYVKILRAQLSAPEINLIAWNGLVHHGEAFKPLIEEYRLLKNMNFSYEMIDLLWLSGKYPHIRKSIWRENPIFFRGSIYENEIQKFEKEEKKI